MLSPVFEYNTAALDSNPVDLTWPYLQVCFIILGRKNKKFHSPYTEALILVVLGLKK